MLKRFAILLCLAPTVAVAETSGTCMAADELDAALIDWHGEHVMAQSEDGSAVLWRNPETGSWTFVEYLASGQACVIDFAPAKPAAPQRYAQLDR